MTVETRMSLANWWKVEMRLLCRTADNSDGSTTASWWFKWVGCSQSLLWCMWSYCSASSHSAFNHSPRY